jgi:hypothetical protein
MNFILDIIGSVIIGSMLLLMMMSFQFQMQEAADRALYMRNMIEHMDVAATKLNSVIALAGVGFTPTAAVTHATPDSLVFQTYWNYQTDQLGLTPITLSIKLSEMPSPYGRALTIRQDGIPLNDLGYIFWVDGLTFKYYDRTDVLTTNRERVRSAEMWLSFFRNPPIMGTQVLRTRLQVKCFFMNAYMRGA